MWYTIAQYPNDAINHLIYFYPLVGQVFLWTPKPNPNHQNRKLTLSQSPSSPSASTSMSKVTVPRGREISFWPDWEHQSNARTNASVFWPIGKGHKQRTRKRETGWVGMRTLAEIWRKGTRQTIVRETETCEA